jgi:hypothetical protein
MEILKCRLLLGAFHRWGGIVRFRPLLKRNGGIGMHTSYTFAHQEIISGSKDPKLEMHTWTAGSSI